MGGGAEGEMERRHKRKEGWVKRWIRKREERGRGRGGWGAGLEGGKERCVAGGNSETRGEISSDGKGKEARKYWG